MSLFGLHLVALLIAGFEPAISDDLESTFQSLKQAASNKDFAQVKVLAPKTCAMARQAAAAPAPESDAEKDAWTKHVTYLRDVELFTEWALSACAVQAPPAAVIELLSTLEQQNPKSKYLDDGYGIYLRALAQTGAVAKAPDVAERAITQFPENEDLLLVLADTAMNRKQSDQALNYSRRLVSVLGKHPKPEAMPAADWERKRRTAMGRGYWNIGLLNMEKNHYVEADKNLRAALPLIQQDQAMAAAALFNLGIANYQLGKLLLKKAQVLEAVKFSEQAAAIPGPYSRQAWHNAMVMKTEAERMR